MNVTTVVCLAYFVVVNFNWREMKKVLSLRQPRRTVASGAGGNCRHLFFYFAWSCCICFNSSGVLILSANAALSFFILDGIITWQ